MQLNKTHFTVIMGGILVLVSIVLIWATNNAGDDLNLMGLSKELENINGGFIDSIATFLFGIMVVFGLCCIIEPLLDAHSPDAYKGQFGTWMVINGIVVLVASALLIFRINEISNFGFGVGCIIAIVGGLLAIVGGIKAQKGVLS